LLETLGRAGFDKFALVNESTATADSLTLKEIG
jgi:hypothetical protein